MMDKALAAILLLYISLVAGCAGLPEIIADGKLVGIGAIEDLDKKAAFSFAIMSDHKGVSPIDDEGFARMAQWMHQSNDRFVIGLGDHLKKGRTNTFLTFVQDNPWWLKNFYPNVADGENEFYGKDQGDWGAGAPILDLAGLPSNPAVTIRPNKCEYYAKLKVKGYTIHLVQLHYPDSGKDPFRADSRQYLADSLRSIEKKEKDIIIAAAHSRTGFWVNELSDEQQRIVMAKCDLVLSATTHCFARFTLNAYGDNGPLMLNTGSTSFPRLSLPGYVQVHILENPFSLVVQYVRVDMPARALPAAPFAFVKIINGRTIPAPF